MCEFSSEGGYPLNLNIVTIKNNKLFFKGEKLPTFPKEVKYIKSKIIDGKIYLNGFELKNNVWKRSIKAMIYNLI